MPDRRPTPDAIPERFARVEDATDFWDSHDLGDFWGATEEVAFDVDLKQRRCLIGIDADLAARLEAEARRRGVSTETLANLWISAKLAESVA